MKNIFIFVFLAEMVKKEFYDYAEHQGGIVLSGDEENVLPAGVDKWSCRYERKGLAYEGIPTVVHQYL